MAKPRVATGPVALPHTSHRRPTATVEIGPTEDFSDIDVRPDRTYRIHFTVYPSALTSDTPLVDGVWVAVDGVRLLHLTRPTRPPPPSPSPTVQRGRGCQEFCLVGGPAVVCQHLEPPPCVKEAMVRAEKCPRGGMRERRFLINAYVKSLHRCATCDDECYSQLALAYGGDPKCTGEVRYMARKKSMMPKNCDKLKAAGVCPIAGRCKGSNPVCNW